ncbi:hypothetical protein CC78DRAFT_618502 [Lojkania enalia]|uniref:Transcription initiation factor IIF subunit alpha n=1 Tax=Lojkania enalia TaxID=147567 RepID=A0A9P4K7J2_9PLEO|nr:hypothetical protein CC78DRAFT_618502 [Didymosphaeria enalia]
MNGNPQPHAVASAANGPRPSSSASSAAALPSSAPTPHNGPPRRRRRPQAADPMRPVYRPLKKISRPVVSNTQMQGQNLAPVATTMDGATGQTFEQTRQQLVSQKAVSLPLMVTRRDLKELRHHVMRLQQSQGKAKVDVLNEDHFTRPIRLHRRDPRAPPSGGGMQYEEEDTKEDLEESKERERIELQKEERRKIREENQAQIAPSASKKTQAFQKKTEQKFRPEDTPEAEKRRLLRYEETLPWHLEDFDNKQTWVGSYESELSETHVMLTTDFVDGRGDVIQMIPLERWYKFIAKGKGKVYSADEVDEIWKKTGSMPKFLSNIEEISIKRERELQMQNKGPGRMRTRVGGGDDDEGASRKRSANDDVPRIKREADADDIDFNMEEDFADDEEGLNGLFEGEEADVKEAAEKLKRDQLAAAAFDLRDEDEIYRQEERERQEAEQQKKLEKKLRKALTKREKNIDYEDDSDSNPYASTSSESDDDTEAEQQRAKEEAERREAEQNGKAADGDKLASGASTRGANTPSGVHKTMDINKKKRPGSPNLSEASGNESSRKKKKKSKHPDGARKSSLVHLSGTKDASKRGAGSGSDSEMTDAGKPKKNKLKVKLEGSPSGSPGGSRAGSPAASYMNGSRAGSPIAPGSAVSASSPKFLPSAAEIYKALPAEGMTIQSLIGTFRDRVDKNNTPLFIKLVKAVSSFDNQRKWLIPLPQMPSEEHLNVVMRGQKAAPKSAAASPS